jgi:5-methyltetrahydrofolate--homocysteine methyltransferase
LRFTRNKDYVKHFKRYFRAARGGIFKKPLQKNILILMEQWELCCNATILQEDFRGERFKDFPHSAKGNNDLLSLTQPQAIKDVHAAFILTLELILLKPPPSQEPPSVWLITTILKNIVYELNYESANCPRSSR